MVGDSLCESSFAFGDIRREKSRAVPSRGHLSCCAFERPPTLLWAHIQHTCWIRSLEIILSVALQDPDTKIGNSRAQKYLRLNCSYRHIVG